MRQATPGTPCWNASQPTAGQHCWPGAQRVASPIARWLFTALTSCFRAWTRPRFSTSDGDRQMTAFISLHDAIAEYVHDGATVAMEAFTHLIPFGAGYEIIRQQKRDLCLIRMTPDLIYDQLIGMGCARRLVFSWGGNPGVGSLHRLRDAVEHGWPHPLELEEHSHAGLANAYVAGASNLPFAVLRGYAGSDLPKYNDHIRFIRCPFTDEELAAVRSVRPDVAVIHAQKAD